MLREECRVGMRVYFGRRNGQQTLGEIEKLNPTKAAVRTLEDRGVQRTHGAGQVWKVPYSMMTQAPDDAAPGTPPPTPQHGTVVRPPLFGNVPPPPVPRAPMTYSPFNHIDNLIMEAIVGCHSGLSPENLSCDGEASRTYINSRRRELTQRLRGLQAALGHTVSESEAYEWAEAQRQYEEALKQRQAAKAQAN